MDWLVISFTLLTIKIVQVDTNNDGNLVQINVVSMFLHLNDKDGLMRMVHVNHCQYS